MLSDASPEIVEGFICYDMESALKNGDFDALCFLVCERYAKGFFWYVYRNLLCGKMIKEKADALQRKCYVEIGCARGVVVKHLQKLNFKSIERCDVFLQSLRFASRRLPNIKWFQYNLFKNKLPYRCDVVGYCHVLEHIEEDKMAVSNLTKMLRPGGLLFITLPADKRL